MAFKSLDSVTDEQRPFGAPNREICIKYRRLYIERGIVDDLSEI